MIVKGACNDSKRSLHAKRPNGWDKLSQWVGQSGPMGGTNRLCTDWCSKNFYLHLNYTVTYIS